MDMGSSDSFKTPSIPVVGLGGFNGKLESGITGARFDVHELGHLNVVGIKYYLRAGAAR